MIAFSTERVHETDILCVLYVAQYLPVLIHACLFLPTAPPAPRNVEGTFSIGERSGPILLWLTWDSQVRTSPVCLVYTTLCTECPEGWYQESVEWLSTSIGQQLI